MSGIPDLSIIILNWNTYQETRDCLDSLRASPPKHNVEIIVADNASSDGSRKMVISDYPEAKLVAHPNNLGFCGGNNKAVPHTSGRLLLFLNSDTIITAGAIDRMIDFIGSNPDIGIVGPKLLNQDGSLQYSCRKFPDIGAGFYRNTPLGRLFPKNRYNQDYLMTDWDHASVRDVDWVSGAAMLIRRELFESLGGFDEEYFMFCEDVDICYRAHQAGQRVVYYPESVIYHIIGRSTVKVPTRMTYLFHRSMYRFYRKHYAKTTSIFVRPIIIPGLIARATGQIVRYRYRHLMNKLRRPKK